MATPKRHEVTCPTCGHTQKEYVEATSTFCHACGHRYSVAKTAPRRKLRATQTTKLNRKLVSCMHCDRPLQIPDASDSWQCPFCSEYLDLKDHIITGSAGRSLLTYGDIVVESNGFFSGNRAEGKNIRISGGSVSGQVKARELLEITKPSKVNADLKSEMFTVASAGAMESRKTLRCQDAQIQGTVRLREAHITGTLHIKAGGALRAELLHAKSIEVEPGGSLIADHAVCLAEQ